MVSDKEWCDDDRRPTMTMRCNNDDGSCNADDRLDLAKMVKEMWEEERDRMAHRPKDWPVEMYVSPQYERCPVVLISPPQPSSGWPCCDPLPCHGEDGRQPQPQPQPPRRRPAAAAASAPSIDASTSHT